MTKKQKIFAWIVFGIYLAWLVWLVLFKLYLPNQYHYMRGIRSVEWIPFASREVEFRQTAREMFYNFLVFIPLGAYLAAFLPKSRWWSLVSVGFAVSVGFEVLQYIFAIGASDVTDVIMNTAGTLCGVLLFRLMRRLFKDKAVPVLNAAGAVFEGLFIAAISVLFLANR